MKYIFDFDDVLFNNTLQLKPHIYQVLAGAGIPEIEARAYYLEVRENEFSLKNFIAVLLTRRKITTITTEELYEKIISECKNFCNVEVIDLVKRIGKDNCYMVTNGEENYQRDKITKSEIHPLFNEIYIVPGTKQQAIYTICNKNKNEKVLFIDDKQKFFDDLDLTQCPNLRALLFDEKGLEKLKEEVIG